MQQIELPGSAEVLDFPYRAKPWVMIACSALFGGCAAIFVREALANDRGLVLNGIVRFQVDGATIFYGCLAALSLVFVAIGLAGLGMSFLSPMRVRLTRDELSAPAFGLSRKVTRVPVSQIRDVNMLTVQGQSFLTVYHHGGERDGKLCIQQQMLPNARALDQLYVALRMRLAERGKGTEYQE